jgi:hypothetical protein
MYEMHLALFLKAGCDILFAGKITNPRDLKRILKMSSKRVQIKDKKDKKL